MIDDVFDRSTTSQGQRPVKNSKTSGGKLMLYYDAKKSFESLTKSQRSKILSEEEKLKWGRIYCDKWLKLAREYYAEKENSR